jgi:hypothetical protein
MISLKKSSKIPSEYCPRKRQHKISAKMGDVKTRKTQSIQCHTANAMLGFVPLC